ncbi:MAG: hypothetical protein JNL67_11885 [Planctomycetaceae bacterium]|nr:hypothetical protein [Planctomycetaceae bacterium]
MIHLPSSDFSLIRGGNLGATLAILSRFRELLLANPQKSQCQFWFRTVE